MESYETGPPGGELVMLLHGFPQPPSAWAGVAGPLGDAGYRAVAPAQRGYGSAPRPAGRPAYRTELLVDDVVARADRLGVDRFHVVGHDWGGAVAWLLAASWPARLRTLTVVSTPHPAAMAAVTWRSTQVLRSLYVPFFRLPSVPEAVLLARGGTVLRRALRSSGLDATRADEYVAAMREPGALTAALNWYRGASLRRLARTGPITVPTLYVWGAGDTALGRAAAEATAAHVVGPYRFETLDDASHWIPEQQADRLVELLLPHLAG